MDAPEARRYRFGDFEIDEKRRSLSLNGERLAASGKAFDLLLELVRRSGSVVGKDELLDAVWPDQFVEENNLSVQVSALRRLLGDGNGARKFIETVPGRGYMFVSPVERLGDDVIVEQKIFERVTIEERSADDTHQLKARSRSNWRLPALGLAVLVIAGFGYWMWGRSNRSTRIDSIAVLPFEYQGSRPDADYLSDGVTESLINGLSQLPNLTVKARGSVFQFKGQSITPQAAAAQLDVQAIVLGKIVENGDSLSMNIELVNAATGDQLWGQRYDRKPIDLATLSHEIATDVASKLRHRLGDAPAARGQTKDPEAYDLYLRGRFLWNKRRQTEHERALALFEQAIARDPNFALAYAAAGDVFIVDSYKAPPGVDRLAKAREYAMKALEIDPNLAEPYATLANVAWSDLDWKKSDEDFLRSIELNPNYAEAHHWRAEMLTRTGRHDEAIAEMKTALLLDPFSQIFNNDYGYILVYARRFEEGLAQSRRSHEMNPEWGALERGWALEYMGRYDEALDAFKGHPIGNSKDPARIDEFDRSLESIRERLRSEGEAGYWRGWFELESKTHREAGQDYYSLAIYHTKLGEYEEAIQMLEKSIDIREANITLMKEEPYFDPLKEDPRFVRMLRTLNLHE